MTVLTVIATDADNGNNGSVTYSLKQVPVKAGLPLFSVDPHMGLITTRLTNALDREVQPIYHVVVQAKDRGSPPMSSQSVYLCDYSNNETQFPVRILVNAFYALWFKCRPIVSYFDDQGAMEHGK